MSRSHYVKFSSSIQWEWQYFHNWATPGNMQKSIQHNILHLSDPIKRFFHILPGYFVVTIPACQTVIWGIPAWRSHNSLNECTNWNRDIKESFILAVHETEQDWIGRRGGAGKPLHAFEVVRESGRDLL